MSSPFQDLNSFPNQFPNLITPKIEPKPEPIDEPIPQFTPQPQHTFPELQSDFERLEHLFRSNVPEHVESSDSTAIVPFSAHAPTAISRATHAPKKYHPRSAELVRVTKIKPEERRYYKQLVRKTRMIYDSLRVFATFQDERVRAARGDVPHRRLRADLKAATWMRENGLWMSMDKRVVGDLPGISIGDVFMYRMEMCVLGLHGQAQAGIDYVPPSHSANGEPIATSIIVSGGYEDDEDAGDVIVYTGHGGQDNKSNKNQQIMHQKLECGNLGMERSMNYGVEVRVIRGFKYDGVPTGKVYVYDGLYRIVDTWFDLGKSGYGVYKFKLIRIENQEAMGSAVMKFAASLKEKPTSVRRGYVALDIARNKEKFGVYFFNDMDGRHDPVYFDYLLSSVFPQFVYRSGSDGCLCEGGCVEGCTCYMKNGSEFPYDQNGILVKGKPLVFECGPHCRCPPSCQNRVAQKGIKNRFEVFRSKETSWGVRSLDLIQAGSFICEYAGVVLTREQVQIFTMNGDNLIHPSRFTERWREWGDLSKVFSDFVFPSDPSVPPLDFAMDVSKMRNLACYICHSTCPNVFVQLVLHDHNNMSFPRLMLFAMENIPPMKELSLDYGVAVADESTGKLAICR